ncbi:hypothetical protein C1T31_01605 [Hanstruepera neustonica]|uniref:Uncharacterized protein n=1 Tax=Hanstruepera neustonica TaxID=1445657 RepID=A0A2K1E3J0_9FLAO|nr:hypothetical protein [Hanstruepera neustonica]PNQ74858.1 hypothetical protein C1T31_01605 [Hanstruepera neustonica]
MKRTFILILILISCKGSQIDHELKSNQVDLFKEIRAKVYKIDSIENYYLVYASKDNYNYKIVSKMVSNEDCNQVKLDSMYSFKIRSLILPEPKTNKNSNYSKPVNYDDFQKCVYMEDFTKICTEVRIKDILISKNLIGLCHRKIQ